ncbi:MAG TPA: PHP domain-containing protein [Thermoanaerobaculia bacterium]
MKVDLHSHSTVSDGTDSPTELVARMAEAGITTLALTDHDTLAGLPEARTEAQRLGIELISGAEISAEWGGQDDIHILALFVDERNARFLAALAERQEERRTRGERMAKKLVEAGYAIDLDAIRADVGDGVWGRPHLARALIRAGYAANNDDAFDRFLGREHPWYVPYEKWKAEDVVAAIASAGGVSSLAHAVWYKDTDRLIRELAGTGLDALEVRHPDHDPEFEERLSTLARELSLATSAGSDFHGAPEGRKRPGGVFSDGAMLEALRARLPRQSKSKI